MRVTRQETEITSYLKVLLPIYEDRQQHYIIKVLYNYTFKLQYSSVKEIKYIYKYAILGEIREGFN